MPKAIQVICEKIFSEIGKTKSQKTSISRLKTRIYSRFLHTMKTSLLRSALSLDDLVHEVENPNQTTKLFLNA